MVDTIKYIDARPTIAHPKVEDIDFDPEIDQGFNPQIEATQVQAAVEATVDGAERLKVNAGHANQAKRMETATMNERTKAMQISSPALLPPPA